MAHLGTILASAAVQSGVGKLVDDRLDRPQGAIPIEHAAEDPNGPCGGFIVGTQALMDQYRPNVLSQEL
jgi:hypothetical protein